MRLPTSEAYILLCAAFQSSQFCQITAFDEGMSLVNALVFGNYFEYRYKS